MNHDIEYDTINTLLFIYGASVFALMVLASNRQRMTRRLKLWVRPDINLDTPRHYIRNSRHHW